MPISARSVQSKIERQAIPKRGNVCTQDSGLTTNSYGGRSNLESTGLMMAGYGGLRTVGNTGFKMVTYGDQSMGGNFGLIIIISTARTKIFPGFVDMN